MSVLEQVQIIPSSLNAGKRETVVVIFPVELPRDVLITFDLTYDRESSSKRPKWSSWVPAQPLGNNSVQVKLPELPYPGQLDVFVKMAREIFSPFPKFKVRVQSPVEAIFHSVSLSANSTTALACIGAYLLQNSEKDRDTLSHVDVILCNILRSQPSLSDWNMSSIICGKYGQDESLLHLCIRQKLEGAASYLLQNVKGRETFLQQSDYKGKTPAEIARKNGEKRIATMVEKAIKEYFEGPTVPPGPGGKLKKSKSLEYEYVHSVQAIPGEDVGPLPLQIKGQGGKGLKQMFGKKKSKSKKTKGPVPVIYPSNMSPPEPSANDGPPLPPRSPIATRSYSVGQEPAIIDKRDSTAEPLEQLLSRCIYTATVLVDYYWDSSPFGDQFSLKRGDKVYVIKEIGDDLCQGVCRNFYCMVPKNILGMDAEQGSDSEEYEKMSLEDDYDMIDDTYEYPEVPPFEDYPVQPPPQPDEPPRVQAFKPPPMKPSIKSHQPHPVPGRLLPNCTLSSSHDTGLDRLGMPRQVSKGKLWGPEASKPSGGTGQTRQLGAFPPGHPASRVSYERTSLKTISIENKSHRPASEIVPPDPDDEYEDATTTQQIAAAVRPAVQQQNKDQHTSSAYPQPRARIAVTRAASVGASSQLKASVPIPKPRVTSFPSKPEPPLLQDSTTRQRKEWQTARATGRTATSRDPPKVADLKKRFENK